jgi:ABC-type siderophore export system fused ATPase/permease subunit
MEKNKTAVEFLIEELKLQEMADKNDLTMVKEILDNARDMEKRQLRYTIKITNDDIWTAIIVVTMIGYLFTMALLIG